MSNQIASNNVRVLNAFNLGRLQSGDWRNPPAGILQCVSCTKHRISIPIVQFYGFDGSQLKCHGCQHKEREEQSKKYVKLVTPNVSDSNSLPAKKDIDQFSRRFREFEENKITEKQENLLKSLLTQKYSDEDDLSGRINVLRDLSKAEAGVLIKELLNSPA